MFKIIVVFFFVSIPSLLFAGQSVDIVNVVQDENHPSYFMVTLDFGGENDYDAHYRIGQKYAEALLNYYSIGTDIETCISTCLRLTTAELEHRGVRFKDLMKRVSGLMEQFSSENSDYYLFSAEIEGMISVLNSRKYGHVSQDHLWLLFVKENRTDIERTGSL